VHLTPILYYTSGAARSHNFNSSKAQPYPPIRKHLSRFPHFVVSLRVEAPAQNTSSNLTTCFTMHRKMESEFKMDMTTGFEKPVPILDALPRKRSAVGETMQKTLPEQELAQIHAGYSTSDNDSGQSEYCRFDADHGPNHLAAQRQRTTAGCRVLRTRHPVSERGGIASEEAKKSVMFQSRLMTKLLLSSKELKTQTRAKNDRGRSR
jgi:hypothetical protein